MLTIQEAHAAFQKAGIRLTPQRMIIVDALVGNRTHPSIEQLYAKVRVRYPVISLATVYKTVALLSQYGLILELQGCSDGVHCDPDTSPHAHAYCENCGTVLDLPMPEILPFDPETLKGFVPRQEQLLLFGLCARCMRQSARQSAPIK